MKYNKVKWDGISAMGDPTGSNCKDSCRLYNRRGTPWNNLWDAREELQRPR